MTRFDANWIILKRRGGFVHRVGLGLSLSCSSGMSPCPPGFGDSNGIFPGGLAKTWCQVRLSDRSPSGTPREIAQMECQAQNLIGFETPEIPESRYGFILHDVDEEWVMLRDCPGIGEGKAKG